MLLLLAVICVENSLGCRKDSKINVMMEGRKFISGFTSMWSEFAIKVYIFLVSNAQHCVKSSAGKCKIALP